MILTALNAHENTRCVFWFYIHSFVAFFNWNCFIYQLDDDVPNLQLYLISIKISLITISERETNLKLRFSPIQFISFSELMIWSLMQIIWQMDHGIIELGQQICSKYKFLMWTYNCAIVEIIPCLIVCSRFHSNENTFDLLHDSNELYSNAHVFVHMVALNIAFEIIYSATNRDEALRLGQGAFTMLS